MSPLPDTVSILLRSSPTAAMTALLLISTSHRGLLDWFSRTVCAEPGPAPAPPRRKARASARCGNGYRQPRANGEDPYLSRRIAKREADDQALVEAMRRNTEATIGELSTAVGKSRSSRDGLPNRTDPIPPFEFWLGRPPLARLLSTYNQWPGGALCCVA